MLDNIFSKEKIKSLLLTIVSLVSVIVITIWVSSNRVEAIVYPISVNVSHIDFGTVFPGETLEENFTVTYLNEVNGITYRIVQKIKPLPDAQTPEGYEGTISDYCQQNPDDLTKCYKNLCPYLIKESVETEGDTENLASLGEGDASDTWTIYFKVPAIFGNVGQDHVGGVVNEEGDYGCDVSVDIIG